LRLTNDQKVELILLYGRNNLSYRQIADIFNERRATVRPLSFTTDGKLSNKFKETGPVHDKKYDRAVPEEDQELVLANAFANPKDSLTKQSKATGFSWIESEISVKETQNKVSKAQKMSGIQRQRSPTSCWDGRMVFR